jgi:hypothetical protein
VGRGVESSGGEGAKSLWSLKLELHHNYRPALSIKLLFYSHRRRYRGVRTGEGEADAGSWKSVLQTIAFWLEVAWA